MTPSEYKAYLQSDEWKRIRTRIRRRARGRCERCGVNVRDDIHHTTYERVGDERLEDLVAVCRHCHRYLHGKSDYDPAAVSTMLTDTEKKRLFHIHKAWAEDYRPKISANVTSDTFPYWSEDQRALLRKWGSIGGKLP
ncbi:MAG: HNH endonuclease [Anaerovoracaceae bacterium]